MSNSQRSKVLSVRLSLDALQSCFDLSEALGIPASGASAAIARSIEFLTKDLRDRGTLPSYSKNDLVSLTKSFMASKNPTSMPSFESLSMFESSQGQAIRPPVDNPVDRRTSEEKHNYTNADFAPVCSLPRERSFDEVYAEQNEYKDLVEAKILEEIQKDEDELLRKILIGG